LYPLRAIVTYWNDELFKNYTFRSLTKYNFPPENFTTIVDRERKIYSVASAFNSINLSEIKEDYLLFLHDDLYFLENPFPTIMDFIKRYPDFGAAGISGRGFRGECFGMICHPPGWNPYFYPFFEVKEVQTLDSMFLLVPKKVFGRYKFYEGYFRTHLFAEDYCLTLQEAGYKVYVLPILCYHHSYSSLVEKFQEKIARDIPTFKERWKHYPRNIYSTTNEDLNPKH
jgi:GT2 family glycosyltransferase